MTTHFEERFATHPNEYPSYDTARLRKEFLVTGLFQPGQVKLTYTHYERMIVGGVLPVAEAVPLETIDLLKAKTFLERRELGAINVGGPGAVIVDDVEYALDTKEALYVGQGAKRVVFASQSKDNPAKFYLNSTPAHMAYPNKKVGRKDADVIELGSLETSNKRTIRKLLVNTVIQTCQLQMGMTELAPGSVWNTMPPPHTRDVWKRTSTSTSPTAKRCATSWAHATRRVTSGSATKKPWCRRRGRCTRAQARRTTRSSGAWRARTWTTTTWTNTRRRSCGEPRVWSPIRTSVRRVHRMRTSGRATYGVLAIALVHWGFARSARAEDRWLSPDKPLHFAVSGVLAGVPTP